VKAKQATLDRILGSMVDTGMITINEEGQFILSKWNAYQECNSAERVRRFRERHEGATEALPERYSNAKVTGRSIEGEKDRGIEEENIRNIREEAFTASPQKKSSKEPKKQRGEFKNVLLTDSESRKLIEEYGEVKATMCVNFLSAYREEKGYKNKSDYLSIRRWVVRAVDEKPKAAETAADQIARLKREGRIRSEN
jgi:hypothetical protein